MERLNKLSTALGKNQPADEFDFDNYNEVMQKNAEELEKMLEPIYRIAITGFYTL